MSLIVWIILGAAAGWIVSLLRGVTSKYRTVEWIIIGIVGAITGGVLVMLAGHNTVHTFDLQSLIAALIGAGIMLGLSQNYKYEQVRIEK